MKMRLTVLFLMGMIAHSAYAAPIESPMANKCRKTEQGPQGLPGPDAIAESTAWGSFYDDVPRHYDEGTLLLFPTTANIKNMQRQPLILPKPIN